MYTVDYFIKKFEAIPEGKWCSFQQDNGRGQNCALGHCNRGVEYDALVNFCYSTPFKGTFIPSKSWAAQFGIVITPHYANPNRWTPQEAWIADVNNGSYAEYQQPTPKERVLACLYDIKAKQEAENTDESVNFVQELVNTPSPVLELV